MQIELGRGHRLTCPYPWTSASGLSGRRFFMTAAARPPPKSVLLSLWPAKRLCWPGTRLSAQLAPSAPGEAHVFQTQCLSENPAPARGSGQSAERPGRSTARGDARAPAPGKTLCPAQEAVGRMLYEAVHARYSSPNCQAAAMDGYASGARPTPLRRARASPCCCARAKAVSRSIPAIPCPRTVTP